MKIRLITPQMMRKWTNGTTFKRHAGEATPKEA